MNQLPGDPSLPPGCSNRDIDGPEPVDDDGMTWAERNAEEAGEHKGDIERES